MTLPKTLGIALCVAVLGGSVAAQTIGPLALLKLLQIVSLRLDALQARADLQAFGPNWAAFSYIDSVSEAVQNSVMVQGWGFGCGVENARVALIVDDIEVGGTPARLPRPDVNAAYAGVCTVVGQTGIQWLVDTTPFEPGWSGNHQHTFKLRVYPIVSSSPNFAVRESQAVTFTTW